MSNRYVIKPFAAWLMLFVMAFSITPKRTVHEIFGCHDKTLTAYKTVKAGDTTIGKDGFHCACEYLEFQTAFVHGIAPQYNAPRLMLHKPAAAAMHSSFHSTGSRVISLRGPPAHV